MIKVKENIMRVTSVERNGIISIRKYGLFYKGIAILTDGRRILSKAYVTSEETLTELRRIVNA